MRIEAGNLVIAFFTMFSLGTGAHAAAADSLNKLSAAEKKAGWILLFDGVDKNLHWREGFTGTTNTWVIDSGYLASAPGSGGTELFTKENYSNFELSLEWKLNIKGNSGVFFRVDSRSRICSSQEFAILDDANGDDRTALGHMPGETTFPLKRTAENYDMYPTTQSGVTGAPYVALASPYDQWNKGVLWANDSLIEHWLNGQKVVDYKIGTADWLQRFSLSKYSNQSCPAAMNYQSTWGRWPTGPIGVQDHGGGLRVWFRNIKVRPIVPGEKLVSPLITPNGGSFAGPVKVAIEAAVTGSAIRYTLDGTDPTESSPLYTDSLTITGAVNLKAKTFRSRFQTSDAASAAFLAGTSSIFKDTRASMEFRQRGRQLFIQKITGGRLWIDLLSMDGKRRASYAVAEGSEALDLRGVEAGLYWMKIRGAELAGAQRILLQ